MMPAPIAALAPSDAAGLQRIELLRLAADYLAEDAALDEELLAWASVPGGPPPATAQRWARRIAALRGLWQRIAAQPAQGPAELRLKAELALRVMGSAEAADRPAEGVDHMAWHLCQDLLRMLPEV